MTADAQAGALPLSDITVVEMGQLMAGPYCGQLLGDFGANVIKLEPPKTGDPLRKWGREHVNGRPMWWPIAGRNKKSVSCDLRTPAGQEVARRLISKADVVVENFRPGTMEGWGLDYDTLSAINAGLVMVRVSGFGQTGPYSQRAGYGSIGEAMGGLRYVTGSPDQPPSRCGISIGDSLTATMACVGTMVALHERQRTGKGQVVDAAIYESVLAVMESLVPEWVLGGHQRERTGAQLPGVAPSNVYRTLDQDMILIAGNADSIFARLLGVIGREELASDPGYVSHENRTGRTAEIDEMIEEWTLTLTADECLSRLEAAGVPAGRIYTAETMVTDPHFAARESIISVSHEEFPSFPMQNVFPKLSRSPGAVRWTGHSLGADTDDVLRAAGYSDAEIEELRSDSVV